MRLCLGSRGAGRIGQNNSGDREKMVTDILDVIQLAGSELSNLDENNQGSVMKIKSGSWAENMSK